MKNTLTPAEGNARPLLILYRALLILAFALGALILGGTLYAAFRGGEANAAGRAGQGARTPAASGEKGIFTGIGRLRIPVSASEGPATLVLSIAFPYPPQDRAFTEELASRVGDFRRIAAEYFSSRTPGELRGPEEEALKAGLLHAYNGILRLGKIETLYFNDLLIFE
jgi:flagellar basal body-associated protein FliL